MEKEALRRAAEMVIKDFIRDIRYVDAEPYLTGLYPIDKDKVLDLIEAAEIKVYWNGK